MKGSERFGFFPSFSGFKAFILVLLLSRIPHKLPGSEALEARGILKRCNRQCLRIGISLTGIKILNREKYKLC